MVLLLACKCQSGLEVNVKINLGGENKGKKKEYYIEIKARNAASTMAMSRRGIRKRRDLGMLLQ